MVLGGNGVVNPFAEQIALGERFIVVAVVAEEMLGDRVGDDFVHVDADALGGWDFFMLSQWYRLGDSALIDDVQSIATPMNCGGGNLSAVVSGDSVC